MYTQCPYCQTVFKIGASQLRLGRGQVQCGHCTEPFLALDYLSDTLPAQGGGPVPLGAIESENGVPEHAPEAPAESYPPTETYPSEQPAESDSSEHQLSEPQEPAPITVYEHVYEPTLGRLDTLDQAAVEDQSADAYAANDERPDPIVGNEDRLPQQIETEIGPVMSVVDDADDLDPEVPEVLREDMARIQRAERARRHRWLLLFVSVLLAGVLAAQYAWFRPDDLLARYPLARPWLEKFCVHMGCQLTEVRDPSRIRVLSRDVRVHPRFEGALLINATLSNTAATTQAFPRLQFTIFNVNGQTIAARRFEPAQYLSPDTNIAAGMPPKRPVQIALEMIAPEEAAVSFEFEFL